MNTQRTQIHIEKIQRMQIDTQMRGQILLHLYIGRN